MIRSRTSLSIMLSFIFHICQSMIKYSNFKFTGITGPKTSRVLQTILGSEDTRKRKQNKCVLRMQGLERTMEIYTDCSDSMAWQTFHQCQSPCFMQWLSDTCIPNYPLCISDTTNMKHFHAYPIVQSIVCCLSGSSVTPTLTSLSLGKETYARDCVYKVVTRLSSQT